MYARSIGRVGALAIALGVGAAAFGTPAISWAESPDSASAGASDSATHEAADASTSDQSDVGGQDSSGPGDDAGQPASDASQDAAASAESSGDGSAAAAHSSTDARESESVGDGDDIDLSDVLDDGSGAQAAATKGSCAGADDQTARPVVLGVKDIAVVTRGSGSAGGQSDTSATRALDSAAATAASVAADALPAPLPINSVVTAPAAQTGTAAADSGMTTVVTTPAASEASSAPSIWDVPGMVVDVATQLMSAALAPLAATGLPGAPGPESALWMMLGFVRRELEQSMAGIAPVAALQQTSLVAASADPLSSVITWFQQTFFAATPTYPAQASNVSLAKDEVSQAITLGGVDADGGALTYTIDGAAAGTGTGGGTLTITGGTATYTPPSNWDGTSSYQDTFVVTASDAGSGPHIHGFSGLLNLVTFGLLGSPGHTTTGSVTITVSPKAPVEVGSFPVSLVNNTNGLYTDDEIFVWIVGQATPQVWSWVDRNGHVQPLDHTQPSSTMTFTLAQAANLRIPPELQGGRIYLSTGQALQITVADNDNGWTVATVTDPADPNYFVPFNYFELAYKYQGVSFGGDNSYIEQTSVVLTSRLQQASSNTDSLGGLPNTNIAAVLAGFETKVGASSPWLNLILKDGQGKFVRILGPQQTQPGGLATWMDPAVDDFWTTYKGKEFIWDESGVTGWKVSGNIVNQSGVDVFKFTVTSNGGATETWTMNRPTTKDVFESSGAFVADENHPLSGAFLAQLNGAFNRGVAIEPTNWWTPSTYYVSGTVHNEYAAYLHSIAADGLIYAFPYDDTNNQSGVQILNNSNPPDLLTITVS